MNIYVIVGFKIVCMFIFYKFTLGRLRVTSTTLIILMIKNVMIIFLIIKHVFLFSILSCSVRGFVHVRKAPRKPLEMYLENCRYLFQSVLRRSVQTKDRLAVALLQFREKSFNLLRRLHALRFC